MAPTQAEEKALYIHCALFDGEVIIVDGKALTGEAA
jgi:hypothetical protein